MKREKSAKIIAIVLSTVAIILIILAILFLIYIYNDYKMKEEKNNNIMEIKGQVFAISKEDNKNDIEEIEPIYIEIPPSDEPIEIVEQQKKERYYYNQLDEYSKAIYKAIYDEKDNIINGTEIIKIPNKVGELLKQSDGESKLRGVLTNALNSFEYDNPELFYIDVSKMVLYYEGNLNTNFRIYIKNDEATNNYFIDGIDDIETINSIKEQLNEMKEKINNRIVELNISTEYEKIKYVHDLIVNNVEYDTTLSKVNRNNIYGVFIEKEATCGGYAKAFKYLVDELGIDCIIIQGEATSNEKTENHAWNYIKINEKWYGVDCTWDDPIILGDTHEETLNTNYDYFFKGKNVFERSHCTLETFIGTKTELNYPELEYENYSTP